MDKKLEAIFAAAIKARIAIEAIQCANCKGREVYTSAYKQGANIAVREHWCAKCGRHIITEEHITVIERGTR